MQIDWFTFFAQIVNFLILVLLLRRFLYGPIMAAMDARESAIADRFHDAEVREHRAQQEIELYRTKRAELAKQEDQILAVAEQKAAESRLTMIHEARDEVETMMSRWYGEVEHEREAILHEIRERLGVLVVKLSDRVLGDVADESLEVAAVSRFVDQLDALSPTDRRALVKSGGRFDQDVLVTSAIELAYDQRQLIIEALGRLLDRDARANGAQPLPQYPDEIGVLFDEDPNLLCGVELRVRDRRVAWTIRDYLDGLDDEIAASLTLESEPV